MLLLLACCSIDPTAGAFGQAGQNTPDILILGRSDSYTITYSTNSCPSDLTRLETFQWRLPLRRTLAAGCNFVPEECGSRDLTGAEPVAGSLATHGLAAVPLPVARALRCLRLLEARPAGTHNPSRSCLRRSDCEGTVSSRSAPSFSTAAPYAARPTGRAPSPVGSGGRAHGRECADYAAWVCLSE